MQILEVILCIFVYFIILTVFRLITIYIIIRSIINIKQKIIDNLKEKMEG